jgi:hypothetical protein
MVNRVELAIDDAQARHRNPPCRRDAAEHYAGLARQATAMAAEGRSLVEVAAAFECSEAAARHLLKYGRGLSNA